MTVAPLSYGAHSNKCPPTTISLLKTAIAPISSEGLRIQRNMLFDDGSRLFITEEVAIKLNLKPTNSEHMWLHIVKMETYAQIAFLRKNALKMSKIATEL